MSLDTRGIDPQRLLPQSLEDRLLGWIGRFAGALLLVWTTAIWISLVSWSVFDPSLTHATTAPARNFAGPIGAIVSDLLFQTLGFAAALALIAPLVWGIEMLRSERVVASRLKLGFYPLSVLALAGAISALPLFDGWPLRHGYGGLLGDGLFHLMEKLFSVINEGRAPLAAGLVLAVAAIQMSGRAIGFEPESMIKSALRALRKAAQRPSAELPREPKTIEPTMTHADRPAQFGWPWSATHEANPADPAIGGLGTGGDRRAFSDEPSLGPIDRRAAEPHLANAGAADVRGPELSPNHQGLSASQAEFETLSAEDDIYHGLDFEDGADDVGRLAIRFAPSSAMIAPGADRARPVPPPPNRPVAKATNALLGRSMPEQPSAPQWRRPSLNMLKRPSAAKPRPELSQTVMRGNARLLEDVLADFGIKGEVKDIRPGPVVTLYEVEPSRGTKSSRVIGLAEDIARSMSVASVRAAVVSGRNAIGLELPNARREGVLLREILEADVFKATTATLPLGLGKAIGGEPVVVDLARMPHLLVAGTTGSGKSVGINAMVLSLLYRHAPDDCRMLMIDPKMLELSVYNGIPHLLTPVITDPHKAVAALNWVVREMEERYKRMAALSVRNIDVFNNRVRNAKKRGEILSRTVQTGFDTSGQARFETQKMDLEAMPRIVVIVDEFADLMIVAGREVEASVQRLAQMARAAGIHLIMATQRPSVDIITGTIKANFPTRISFKVTSKIDSRTILNEQGAEQLLGQGDMLYSTGAGQLARVHGAFVSDEEVVAFAEALRRERPPAYVAGITDVPAQSDIASGAREPSANDLYDRAVAIVLKDGKASTSYIQRRLSIGYNRAADLIERMEREGLISAANGVGKREILVPRNGAEAAA
jgi:S-DNA-T family DNA segregation ATPase FtsK/SpoIIIE